MMNPANPTAADAATATQQLTDAVRLRLVNHARVAIAAGADVDARLRITSFREEGIFCASTPLVVFSAGFDNGALAELLLDAGANPMATDDRGWNALHRAEAIGNTALADRLRAVGVQAGAEIRDGLGADAKQAAKRLNDQHIRTSAGFYSDRGRRFGARVHGGALQVMDWDAAGRPVWEDARPNEIFRDHNGRDFLRFSPPPVVNSGPHEPSAHGSNDAAAAAAPRARRGMSL